MIQQFLAAVLIQLGIVCEASALAQSRPTSRQRGKRVSQIPRLIQFQIGVSDTGISSPDLPFLGSPADLASLYAGSARLLHSRQAQDIDSMLF